MSFGLGYIADGLLKGQNNNRDWSLRQKQEERAAAGETRAQESHGIGMRIGEVNANLAEEKMTPDAVERRRKEADIGFEAKEVGLQNAKKTGVGIQQQNELRAEDLTPKAVVRREAAADANLKSLELQNEYNGYRNSEVGRKNSEEVLAWEKHLEEIVNQTDEATSKVKLAEAIDMKRYRMIQFVESGDGYGAAMMVNGTRANKHENITKMEKTKDGGIIGYDDEGNVVVNISPEEVSGVVSRVNTRLERENKSSKSKEPKVLTEKVYDDYGEQIGEKAYVVKTDPQTGEQYKQYIQERAVPSEQAQTSQDEELSLAKMMVEAGEMTPAQYEKLYGQPYASSTSNAQPTGRGLQPSNEYDVTVPPLGSSKGTQSNQGYDPDIPLIF